MIKFLFKLIFWLCLLLTISLFSLVIFINPNNYKPQIRSFIEKYVDYKVYLNGNIKWSFWPKFSVNLQNVTVMNQDNTKKLLETESVYITTKPIDYIKTRFIPQTNPELSLQLNNALINGLTIKLDIENKITLNLNHQLKIIKIIDNIQVFPSEYKTNNPNTLPLNLTFTKEHQQVNLVINEKAANLEMISHLFMNEPLIFGTSNINLQLTTNITQDLLKSLTGNIDLLIFDGKLKGIDIFRILTQSEEHLNTLSEIMKGNVKQSIDVLLSNKSNSISNITGTNYSSAFTTGKIHAVFKEGIISASDISLQHSTYSVQGDGLIDLMNNKLECKLQAMLNKIAEQEFKDPTKHTTQPSMNTSFPLLIKINGPIANPEISIDLQEYLRSGLLELQKKLLTNPVNTILPLLKHS